MKKVTVLCVDDDPELQQVVAQYLGIDGHTVVPVHSGAELREKLPNLHADVILLDLILPDQGGVELIPIIRAACRTPIIVVSGKSDTTEKILCLEMGADDYITKPFLLRELAARIKAVVRRATDVSVQAKPDRIFFDGWCLDRAQFQLFNAAGESVALTAGEFRLLEALVLASNRVLTRDYLFELTRDAEFEIYDRAVDIQIGRIRRKIEDDPKNPRILKTVRGVGYMFCGTVKE